jgi:hypothetical protein
MRLPALSTRLVGMILPGNWVRWITPLTVVEVSGSKTQRIGREVAGTESRQRDRTEAGDALYAALRLPGEEEERTVPIPVVRQDHRSADGAAELVHVERGDGHRGAIEEVFRVEGGVAQEFEKVAVEVAAAALVGDVHGAAAAPEFGAGNAGLQAELLNGFDGRVQHNSLPVMIFGVIDAIHAVVIRTEADTVDDVRRGAPRGRNGQVAGLRLRRHHARRQANQLIEIACVERQVLERLLVLQGADGDRFAFEQQRGGFHVHGLGNGADFHREVEDGALVQFERQLGDGGAEARSLGAHGIGAGTQRGRHVLARGCSASGKFHTRGFADEVDFRAGDDRSRGVLNGAGNQRRVHLCA